MARKRIPTQDERRWSADDARSILNAHAVSGVSVAAFARMQGVDVRRLYFWRRRLSSKTRNSFIEVVRPGGAAPRVPSTVEVELRSGDVIRLSGDIDTGGFRRIVEVLRSC